MYALFQYAFYDFRSGNRADMVQILIKKISNEAAQVFIHKTVKKYQLTEVHTQT